MSASNKLDIIYATFVFIILFLYAIVKIIKRDKTKS
jgi:hypothetical protein